MKDFDLLACEDCGCEYISQIYASCPDCEGNESAGLFDEASEYGGVPAF